MPRTVFPKPDGERQRRNKRSDEMNLEWDGVVRGPTLPTGYPWCKATKKWWNKFRRSPQAMICAPSDWQFMIDTALIYDRIWRDPENIPATQLATLMSELRRRTAVYGFTSDDRMHRRMNLKTDQSEQAKEATVKADAEEVVDYFTKLTQEVSHIQK